MGQISFLLFHLSTEVYALAITSSPQALANIRSTSSPVNITLEAGQGIDPRFGLNAYFGETDIPVTAFLMIAVDLLAQYAQLEWLSKVGQRSGVVLPAYPQIEVAVIPANLAPSIEVRLVVWAIWVGAQNIIFENQFHEVEFQIEWENKIVGYLYVTKPMDLFRLPGGNDNATLAPAAAAGPLTLLSSSGPNGTTDVGLFDASNGTAQTSPAAALDEGSFLWKPYFLPEGRTLTIFEVFLTAMAGIKSAAPHGALDKVLGPYASAAINVNANVQFYIHKRRQPRPRPPFFQYIHVIKSLRLLPGYMLQKRKFSELYFGIEVDGLQVGEGYMEKGQHVPPAFIPEDMRVPMENISLS